MHVGEVAEVKVSPRFAYGSKGVKEEKLCVPPDATLHYTVELLSSSPEPELETMTVNERKEIGYDDSMFLFHWGLSNLFEY